MSSTGRPRRPPLALTSSRQSWSAIKSCLPFCATPPVIAKLNPTLIGSAAEAGVWVKNNSAAAAAKAARQMACMDALPVFTPRLARSLLLHHLVARHDAPQIRSRRVLLPHLRPLRIVAVPRPRLEIAEFLVHAVELGKSFGNQAIRRAVIGKEVVADAVTTRSP